MDFRLVGARLLTNKWEKDQGGGISLRNRNLYTMHRKLEFHLNERSVKGHYCG